MFALANKPVIFVPARSTEPSAIFAAVISASDKSLVPTSPVASTCPVLPPLATSLNTPSLLIHFNQKCQVVPGSVTKVVILPVNSVTTITSLSVYVGIGALFARIFPYTSVRICPPPCEYVGVS